jgi:cell shape-determining protein MreC
MAWRSTRVLVGAAVAVALLLILLDVRGAGATDALRGVAGAVAGPPERALAWVRTQAAERLGGSAQERARIAELEQQLAQARAQAGAAAAGTVAEADARALAAFAPAEGFTPVAGRVVSISAAQDPARSAAISTGSGDGIRSGLAVLGDGGLVGLVDSVSPQVSTVRLAIDPATQVAARVASSGELGVFRGTGSAGSFELLDPLGRMAPGDLIVTLGTPSGDLPADLPLGRIAGVTGSSTELTRAAEVTPAVDESTMDRVAVLVPGPTDPGS